LFEKDLEISENVGKTTSSGKSTFSLLAQTSK